MPIPRIYPAVALAALTASVLLANDRINRETWSTPVGVGNARPVSPRGLTNLTAFTKLIGYVRYFYPSIAANHQDWNTLAVHGVRILEDARDSTALLTELCKIFHPIAPALVIAPTGTPLPAAPPPEFAGDGRRLAWRHFGFSEIGQGNPYRSELIEVDSPRRPFVADLGAGLSCSFPMMSSPEAEEASVPAPLPGYVFPATDRASRLAGVALAWNVLEHFYPYFDVIKTDWPGALRRGLTSAALDEDQGAFLETMRRMVASLHDGHGYVSAARQPPRGCLPLTWEWVGEELMVTDSRTPILATGDVVLRVEGVPVAQLYARAEQLQSGATPRWVRVSALSELTQGRGSRTALEVRRHQERTIRRVEIDGRDCSEVRSSARTRRKLEEVEPGIYYVDIDRLTSDDFSAALPDLVRASGIVFDFRGYPRLDPFAFFSHLSRSPLSSPQWHVPIITRPDRVDMSFRREGEWLITPRAPYIAAKKAFLINETAISFSESCLGIVEHYRLGELVGTATAGTNGDVTSFGVPGELRIQFTGMKVLKHDGSRHHGVGIQPTIPVNRTAAGIAAGRDEQLERALAVVRGTGAARH